MDFKTIGTQLDMSIAGVGIRLDAPFDLALPWDLQPFVVPQVNASVHYQIELLDAPIIPDTAPVYDRLQMRVYPASGGWLRIYPHLADDTGVAAAVLLRPNGDHTLFLPRRDLERYRVPGVLSPILGLEYVLMQAHGFILHSSVVIHNGQAVLFCGASGAGKSTQAALWERYFGATIVNGDRCAVMQRGNGFWGCGSPFSGSSEIYLAQEAPIAAIVFVEKGPDNQIVPASPMSGFRQLYAQTAANTWDADYTQHLCDLLESAVSTVPMFTLRCRPDEACVRLTCQTIFPSL